MPWSATSRRFATIGVMLASALLSVACTRNADDSPAVSSVQAKPASFASSNDQDPYRYLYTVYCNGTVDRLDLVQRSKVGSFQLSERSGSPPAVAALAQPGVRPGGCLARSVATDDAQDRTAAMVHIVASSHVDPDADGRKPYQLLTFELPQWTLQQTRNLGSLDAPPRLAISANASLTVQPRDEDPAAAMAAQVQSWAGADAMTWANAIEWSAGNVLLTYALPDQRGTGAALALRTDARIVRLAEFRHGSGDIPPDLRLAPGGQFVLATMKRSVPLGEGLSKVEATGELRLYGADGRQLSVLNLESLAGSVLALSQSGKLDLDQPRTDNDWFNVALTPGGLAVFTDRRGNYQFIALGHTFRPDPVIDPALDDADGARPALVYAAR